ncbi:MAG: hypothetical protein WCA35_16580, partial [Kovacikia sp.]
PKAFRGHIDAIQRNAITSWTLLEPKPEIILLGDDEGTAEIARELHLKHIPEVERNEYGTPLLSSLFELAQRMGTGPLFAYINSDIILMSDFMQAVQRVPFRRFMLTGQRWNLDLGEPIGFKPGWESQLRDRVCQSGNLEGPQAMDYFVFTRDTYREIPRFAIGRTAWDNWLLCEAFRLNAPVIDATQSIAIVHQNHDYSHHPEGTRGIWEGPEAQQNIKLLGGRHYAFFMLDLANWLMTDQALKRSQWTWQRLDRYLDMMPLARPQMKVWATPLLKLLRMGNPIPRVISKVKKIPAKIVSRLN